MKHQRNERWCRTLCAVHSCVLIYSKVSQHRVFYTAKNECMPIASVQMTNYISHSANRQFNMFGFSRARTSKTHAKEMESNYGKVVCIHFAIFGVKCKSAQAKVSFHHRAHIAHIAHIAHSQLLAN